MILKTSVCDYKLCLCLMISNANVITLDLWRELCHTMYITKRERLTMFHVYMLDSEGYPKLLEVCIDEERAYHSMALWSDTYPHATVDYIYKDTN